MRLIVGPVLVQQYSGPCSRDDTVKFLLGIMSRCRVFNAKSAYDHRAITFSSA